MTSLRRAPLDLNNSKSALSLTSTNLLDEQVPGSADHSSSEITGTTFSAMRGGPEVGHGVREVFLFREPPEELLKAPVLLVHVGVGVPVPDLCQVRPDLGLARRL